MPPKPKSGATKGAGAKKGGSAKPSGPPSKSKKPGSHPAKKPEQQKTKSADKNKSNGKKKPPHLRYTEKELKVPLLNGIKPAGVSKPPNSKKGKKFVEDRESINTILAMVMAEKEGNIESKMMRARRLEEVREARKIEMEKRAASKKAGFEDRKKGIKEQDRKPRKGAAGKPSTDAPTSDKKVSKNPKKRVSFG